MKQNSDVPAWQDLPAVMLVEEAAAVLRLGRNATYESVRRGEIPSIRIGRRLLIPKSGLERLLGVGAEAAQRKT
jgi:excisionase family DNA binding protein